MKNPYDIIVKPVLSEKSLLLSDDSAEQKQYVFKVHIKANKKEVKKAIEQAFGVHVTRVNALRMKGKPKRVRMALGFRPDWKKVFVTLKQGETIDLNK